MVAFCRFIDASGRPQMAIAAKKNLAAQTADGRSPNQVCLLANLIGDDAADRWAAHHDWLAGDAATTLPPPRPDQWQDAPVVLLPPIVEPEKVICIGLNYRDHAIETGASIPDEPVVFSKFKSSLIGHGQPIVLPTISREVDYEAELVVVVGQTARHVSRTNAMKHVFGYTIGHDVSARDWQKGRPGGQWLLGKTFDTFAPLGPWLITADEIADPGNLSIRLTLNGTVMQDSWTSQLIFDIPTLIEHLSRFMTLKPGDLIFTGTPAGVGAAKSPPVFLQPGDQCVVTIDGLGSLANSVVGERRR